MGSIDNGEERREERRKEENSGGEKRRAEEERARSGGAADGIIGASLTAAGLPLPSIRNVRFSAERYMTFTHPTERFPHTGDEPPAAEQPAVAAEAAVFAQLRPWPSEMKNSLTVAAAASVPENRLVEVVAFSRSVCGPRAKHWRGAGGGGPGQGTRPISPV